MLNPDYRDILLAFVDQNVEFLVIGAYALAVHGYPRATGDIDLWVKCSSDNAQRVWAALEQFGAPLFDLSLEDLSTPGVVFQIGVVPRRIDITTEIDGIKFEEAWPEREEVEVEGISIAVISRNHLLVNKRASGRPKDLIDANWLEQEPES